MLTRSTYLGLIIGVLVVLAIGWWLIAKYRQSSSTRLTFTNLNSTTPDLSVNNQTADQELKPQPIMTKAVLQTDKGNIAIELFIKDAPRTTANFTTLASKGFYNNIIFHRVIKGFMIQGGDPTGTGRGGPGYTFADELNPATESYKQGYKRGVVAMANAGPNTNGSQFFIMHADYPLPHSYTIFGQVTSGLEVVDTIALAQTDANDRPLKPVAIQKITLAE